MPTSPKPKTKTNIPLAARLPFFIHQWRKVTNNNWILRVVEEGYKLQFNPDPPHPRPYALLNLLLLFVLSFLSIYTKVPLW